MIGRLPQALEDEWHGVLVSVARALRLPSIDDPTLLGPHVASLAALYNDGSSRAPQLSDDAHLAARIGFSFPRDVPKMAGAVRELVAIGKLRIPADRPLRVLDLGAGLGASHRGLARALAAAGATGSLDVMAIDADAAALSVARSIVAARPREGGVDLRVRTDVREVSTGPRPRGRFDVILIGQLLSELDRSHPPAERVESHRAFIASVMRESLDEGGVVVVVEPALRARARHLQNVRAALLGSNDARVVAPCLHQERCPLLGRETDWCHEDLPVDLPTWLVPIAKRAGLRWEGLTFSYLALAAARDASSLRDAIAVAAKGAAVRAVSGPLVSKGKHELVVCGDVVRPTPAAEDPLGPRGARIGRLDREASDDNAALTGAGRGDVLDLRAPLDDKLRVRRDGVVVAIDEGELTHGAAPSP